MISGVAGSGIPIPEFRIPNSVWRMGDPEYRTIWLGTADRGRGRARADVTGSDMVCRTSECYVNSGVGHRMSWGGQPGEGGQGRKGKTGPLGNKKPRRG